MKQNLPDSIFIIKDLSERERKIRIPFIKELKGDPVLNGENDVVFQKTRIMKRIEMYSNITGKKVAEWEEPVDDIN